MAKFNTGQSFADGDTVTGAKLNNITSQLNIYTGVISEQTAMVATVSTADQLLIADTDNGDSGAANRVTVQKLLNDTLSNGTYTNAQLSGNLNVTQLSTLGTISSTRGTVGILNSTTGTIATLNSTTGTIAGLSSTNGTIATLSATTSTFLGTITGSTNVVNIGSGQIYKDASGNVGVGTASPTAQVTISKVVNSATLPSTSANHSISLHPPTTIGYYGGGISWAEGANTSANICAVDDGASGALGLVLSTGNNSAITERLRITSVGRVGIGTVNPARLLTVDNTPNTEIALYTSGTERVKFSTGGSAASRLAIDIGGTERLRIDSAGQIGIGGANYGTSGQVLTSAGTGAAPSWQTAAGITSGTAVASTSGTAIDFTGIPSTVKRITVMFDGVSTNGASIILVQIGDSGGIENTSYVGVGGAIMSAAGSSTPAVDFTTGFGIINDQTSASIHNGIFTLALLSSSSWVATSSIYQSNRVGIAAGSKTLSATLDRIRITTVNGTDTFDAGSINIMYEG